MCAVGAAAPLPLTIPLLCGSVRVPSGNASMLDNAGMVPIPPPVGACP